MKNIINYLSNQAVNASSIWGDSSLFIALLLLVVVLILYFYAKDVRDLNDQLADDVKSLNELCKEKTKAFEDAVAEITELRSKVNLFQTNEDSYASHFVRLKAEIKFLESCNSDNLERINKLTSQIKHTKYMPLNQVKEAEMWVCTKSIDQFFIQGKEYRQGSKYKKYFSLIAENGTEYIIGQSDFKPVKK